MTSILFFLPALFLLLVALTYFFEEKIRLHSSVLIEKVFARLKILGLAAIILPYAASAFILFLGTNQPIAHFKLEGYKFSLPYRLVTVGGSGKNDIYIKDFPPDSLYFKKTDEGHLELKKGTYYEGLETVRIGSRIPGLIALKNGSKIKIKSEGKIFVFEISHSGTWNLKVKYNKKSYSIPLREVTIPIINKNISLWAYPKAYNQIFPLRKLISNEAWKEGKGFKSSILFGDFDAKNKEDKFVEPFLLVLDAGVSVDDQEIVPFPTTIKNGQPLSFIRAVGTKKPRLRTVMKFKEVRILTNTVEFYLERPQTIAVKLNTNSAKNRFFVGNIKSFTGEIIQFARMSRTFSNFFAILDLEKEFITASGPFTNEKLSYNQTLEIGGKDKLLVNISRKETPWNLILLLIFTGCVVGFFAFKLVDKLRYVVILGSVAVLTCARLIFSYSASVLPPFSSEAIPLAIFAITFIPSLVVAVDCFIKALECKDQDFIERRRFYVTDGILALVFTLMVGIPHSWHLHSMLFLGALLPVLLLVALLLFLLFIDRFPRLKEKIKQNRDKTQSFLSNITTTTLLVIAGVFLLLRIFLFFTGSKESVSIIGSRFSISIITVPVLIFFIALCTTRFIQEVLSPNLKKDKKIVLRYIGFVFGFCAIFFISALFSSDLGQMLYALPIGLFLIGMAYWSYNRFIPKEKGFVLILVLPLVLTIFVLFFPFKTLQLLEFVAEGDFHLDKITKTDEITNEQNILRLMQYVAPQHLDEIGSRSAEAVAQHHAIMDANTRRGWLGVGFGNIKVHSSLYRTCLNDNVSAVYIMSQFGVLGALAIIIAYCLLLLSGFRTKEELLEQGSQFWRFASSLSILSILVLMFISLYMLGANCNLFLFTGRNLYFLGLNSMSDIYESALLLAFIVAGVSIGDCVLKRDERGSSKIQGKTNSTLTNQQEG